MDHTVSQSPRERGFRPCRPEPRPYSQHLFREDLAIRGAAIREKRRESGHQCSVSLRPFYEVQN